MEISTGVSTSTFRLVVSEATYELVLLVIAAVVLWYFKDIRKFLCKFSKSWNLMRSPKAANLIVKQPKCFENEHMELEATSSEQEPEAELFPTQKTGRMPPAPKNMTSLAVLESADLSEPESQEKINGNYFAVPQVLQPQPVWFPPPGLGLPAVQSPLGEKASKRKKNSQPKPQPEAQPRELGRCVCWKDSFGFIVDENGTNRLFVRQTDIEGEKALLAGQIVWFRRGVQQPRQTPKAMDVVLVDIEMAKILRAAERDGIPWTTFRNAVIDGDSELLASFKSLQSSANNKNKLASFKAGALGKKDQAGSTKITKDKAKGSDDLGEKVTVLKATAAKAGTDADLKAFLGSGSIEEMRANLKYAPKWVTDKFNSQYGLAT